jgi:mannan endo-1,4-beta-mannosidase
MIENSGMIAGCNFWGWGGYAVPTHEKWQCWDDYTCDPAQEQQGLNSVFASDTTTLAIISKMTKNINRKH